jgi:hypothetical protein
MFLIQRSFLLAMFIPHEDFTPKKYLHSSMRGSAEGGYSLNGVRGAYPPDQNLDQGSKICSIFKVLGMRRKRCHCVRLVLLIPAVYLFSQTESVWRSYRGLFAEPNR